MTRVKLAAVASTLLLAMDLLLAGCGGDAEHSAPSTQQGVGDVMQEQMQQGDEQAPQGESFVGDTSSAYEQIDYDLPAMNSDMVYATVNDMMQNPKQYKGKVIRMKGPFYHMFSKNTKKDYYCVVIQDATACCSQGLEFVWGDGSHVYPDEYPKDGAEVVVTGKFGFYTEGSVTYAHLVDASLEAS